MLSYAKLNRQIKERGERERVCVCVIRVITYELNLARQPIRESPRPNPSGMDFFRGEGQFLPRLEERAADGIVLAHHILGELISPA